MAVVASIDPDHVLPGTTMPSQDLNGTNPTPQTKPSATPGPLVHGRATTLTLYNPDQLAHSPALPSLQTIVNNAYQDSGARHKILGKTPRLRHPDQFLQEVGREKGTFTYILTYAGTADVVGTVSLRRFVRPIVIAQGGQDDESAKRDQTFTRFELPACAVGGEGLDVEAWELKLMAVDPGVQRQGVAGLLMGRVEEEAKRRWRVTGATARVEERRRRLVLLLTSIMEINGGFYRAKGYVVGSETYYEAGHLGSERGLTIEHLSKVLDEV